MLDVPEGHHHEEVPEKPANSSKVLTLVIIIVVALLLIWGGRGIPQGLKPLLLVAGFLAVIWLFTPQASAEESRDLPSVQRLKHTENPKINLNDLNPRELEFYLANTINQLIGWQAEVTKAANDQGADVIVTGPQGQRIAIQVKHYKRKVGNKAVQEIVASKALYDCTHAVVFTSGPGYTSAAKQLAKANQVPLWEPTALITLQAAGSQGLAMPDELLPFLLEELDT